MELNKIDRYPGIRPFTQEYKDIFFGRDEDIDDLCKYINVDKITVLFGKSGMGKSSLINAGIVPKLESENNLLPIFIRFGSHSELNITTPLEIVAQIIKKQIKELSFLDKIENENITLWQYFKNLQLQHKDKSGFLLIFDQFEELFTYQAGTNEFAKEFSKVLNSRIPKLFRYKLNEILKNDPDIFSENDLNFIEGEINLKVLFSIRSDRMSNLNKLSDYIPSILRNCFELKPLTKEDAEIAIIKPSQMEGNFNSSKFQFEKPALDKILNYLSHNNKTSIESFQLQLICQHIEQNIVIKNNDFNISESDIGDVNYITKYFYAYLITILGSPQIQYQICSFIEEQLIRDNRRISLDEAVCLKFISKEHLQKLVDNRLLRSEPNTTGGINFELSHDTLINPILERKKERIDITLKTEKKTTSSETRKNIFITVIFGIVLFAIFIISLTAIIMVYYIASGSTEASRDAYSRDAYFSLGLFFYIGILILISINLFIRYKNLKKKYNEALYELKKYR